MAFQVRRTKSGSTNIGVESWNDDLPTCHKPHWVEETHLRYSEKELCPRSEVRWLNQSDSAREDQHTLVSLAVIQRKSIAWWWRGDKGISVLLTIATPKKVEKVQTPMNLYWWLEAFCIFGVQDSLIKCFRQCCINWVQIHQWSSLHTLHQSPEAIFHICLPQSTLSSPCVPGCFRLLQAGVPTSWSPWCSI